MVTDTLPVIISEVTDGVSATNKFPNRWGRDSQTGTSV